MKIKYLGTGAYEGIPALFCTCPICLKAMEKGGKNIRTRSQALIDDKILIDFNADTYSHFITHKIDFTKVKWCFITHSHYDHLDVGDIQIMRPDYSYHPDYEFTFYSGDKGCRMIREKIEPDFMKDVARCKLLRAFNQEFIPGYRITPLPANHDQNASPFIFLIEELKTKKHMLYAHDSGFFFEDVFDYLYHNVKHLDLVSLDCTGATKLGWKDHHMSIDVDKEVIERLKKDGIVDDKTKIVLNHFSHNGGANYDDLVKLEKELGVIISYDGLEVEF